jgi:hypothetical protein
MKKIFPKTAKECDELDCSICGYLKEDEDGFECTETKLYPKTDRKNNHEQKPL